MRQLRYEAICFFASCHFLVTTVLVANDANPVSCSGHSDLANYIAISPDATIAASGGNALFVRLWDTSSGEEKSAIRLSDAEEERTWLESLAFSPDGKQLAVAAHGLPIRFFDPLSGDRIPAVIPISVENAAFDLAYSPDGSKIAVADGKAVRIWELATNKLLREFRFSRRERVGRVCHVVFSPDGNSIAAALKDSGGPIIANVPRMRVWNVDTGDTLFDVWEDNGSDQDVSFSADGQLVAEASKCYPGRTNVWKEFPGAVFVWDIATKKLRYRVPADKVVTTCVAFSPNGRILATGGHDTAVKLWDATTGELVRELQGHEGQILDLAFSKNGQKLASVGTDKKVLIWSMESE